VRPNNAERPVLVAFCGLPGSGKTALAREIETSTGAVRINTDEWVADLGVDFFDYDFREKLQIRLYLLGVRLLEVGQSITFEDGLWTRDERDTHREVARDLGAAIHMHYFDVPFEELWRRLEIRNAIGAPGVVPISRALLERSWLRFERPDETELSLFDRYFVHIS
jgi:predicted kinase